MFQPEPMKAAGIIKIIAHPLFITLVIAAFFLPFMHHFFPKFQAKVNYSRLLDKEGGYLSWIDINSDGESEQFTWFTNTEGKAEYKITSQSGFLRDQESFNGESMTMRNPPCIGDSNNDNNPEVYAFYHRSDSLFLTLVEYSDDSVKNRHHELFVIKVPKKLGKTDFDLVVSSLEDLDGDSAKELIFSVNAGHPVVPRNCIIYFPETKKFVFSKYTGAIASVGFILDLNNDGRKELILGQYAPGNLTDSTIDGVNDQYVRLVVMNTQLDTVFNPPKFGEKNSGLNVFPFQHNGQYYIAAIHGNARDTATGTTLMVFNPQGKMLKNKKIWTSNTKNGFCFIPLKKTNGVIHLLDYSGTLSSYNFSLELIRKEKFKYLSNIWPEYHDLDGDRQPEYVFCNGLDNFLIITRDDLSHPVRVEVPHEGKTTRFSMKRNRGRPDELCVQFNNRYYLIAYRLNPFYPFRFLAWLLASGILALFVYLIQYLQRLLLKEKYRTERRMSELQLLLLRNQVSPHFLFNAINTISARIYENKPEEAHTRIVQLSKLMRSALISSDQLSRTLNEELEAVTAYVELVRSQRREPFVFTIDLADITNTEIQVPVMCIQNYTENAIKHGLSTLGGKGRLGIGIRQDEKYLRIAISDNGIGRAQAAVKKDKPDSTGKGLALMQQYFNEVNKYNEYKITCSITDLLAEDGSLAGTRVELEIPVQMKYRIYE